MHWIILYRETPLGRWQPHRFLYGDFQEATKIAARWVADKAVADAYVHPESISLRDGSNQDVP